MEKGGWMTRLAGALLLVIFLVYIGFQVVSNLGDQITTVDAVVVTVEDVISAEGVFVRSQALAYGETGKTADYLVADGEKVSNGQPLVVFFDNASAAAAYQKLRVLNSKLDGLKKAYQNISGGSDGKKLDSLIYISMQQITAELESGSVEKAAREYPALQQLIISRSASMAGQAGYQAQIDELERERNEYRQVVSGGSSYAYSGCSGYFFRHTDGYETVFTPDTIVSMEPRQILEAKPDSVSFAANVVGTITDSYEWYYAAVLTKGQADQIRNHSSADVYFPQISAASLTVTLSQIITYGDSAVAIFKSGVMSSNYLDARRQPADIVVKTYTGIKVPKSALRQVDGKWGVYCLEGAMSIFKEIEWIYQTDTYYLVESAASAKAGLYMYDKIIIGGKDLQDSKVVR